MRVDLMNWWDEYQIGRLLRLHFKTRAEWHEARYTAFVARYKAGIDVVDRAGNIVDSEAMPAWSYPDPHPHPDRDCEVTLTTTAPAWWLAQRARAPRMERAITGRGRDIFDAFCRVREELEKDGFRPRCYGASRRVFPSAYDRDMPSSDAYQWPSPDFIEEPKPVSIFASGPDVEPVTVAEQFSYFEHHVRNKTTAENGLPAAVHPKGWTAAERKRFLEAAAKGWIPVPPRISPRSPRGLWRRFRTFLDWP